MSATEHRSDVTFSCLQDAADWYVKFRATPHRSYSAKKVAAATAAAVKVAKETEGSEPFSLDDRIALVEGGRDKRLHAFLATLWVHLDSQRELGYACSQSVFLWSFRKRSECELEADLAAQGALTDLYNCSLSRIVESIAKLRRGMEEVTGRKDIVNTSSEVLIRYALHRKELLGKVLASVEREAAAGELKRGRLKDL